MTDVVGVTEETIELWLQRVADWRASGIRAEIFAEGKDFKGTTLRFWMSKLRRIGRLPKSDGVSFARVARRVSASAPHAASVVTVALGDVRVEVPRVDEATLRIVLRALREDA